MTAFKTADSLADPNVPELDAVVGAGCKERVQCHLIPLGIMTLVEFDRVNVFLMVVIENSDRLVRVGVVYHKLLVRTTHEADVTLSHRVVKTKGWDAVS